MKYSIVNYKTVKENSDSFRCDAEYFQIQPLLTKISETDNVKLKTICDWITQGPNPKFSDDGTPCLTGRNISTGELIFNSCDLVDNEELEKCKRFRLLNGDILITLKGAGSTGKVIIFYSDKKSIFSRNLGLIRLAKQKLTPEFLFAFLNSELVQKIIDRGVTGGTGQLTLPTTYLKNIRIPDFRESFIEKITILIKKYQNLTNQSKSLYSQAEQLLLSELGLIDWKPKHELSFVKNYSDTQQAERFDAEYFQPKYEEIIEAVKKYKDGFDELGDLVKVKKSVEPGSEAYQENGIPFVRVSNLSKFEIGTNNQQFLADELYETFKKHQPKKGEILLSKDATPGIAYFLNEDPQKMIVSGGILRLKDIDKQVLPEYLTLVLNSVVVQKQIEQYAGGSIIKHWRPDQVKTTIIPILSKDNQKEIKELIEESFADRKLSKSLLEIAKQGVEMAIEKDEQEAEKWINNEVEKLGVKI